MFASFASARCSLEEIAKRVADTGTGAQEAAASVAHTLGVGRWEARAAIDTAAKLERLPETDAAVRAGRLSARAAQLIAGAATVNPAAERDLLQAATQGLVPLRDACVAARAQVEDPTGATGPTRTGCGPGGSGSRRR